MKKSLKQFLLWEFQDIFDTIDLFGLYKKGFFILNGLKHLDLLKFYWIPDLLFEDS